MERLTRELSHDEEFMLFKEEFGEIVGNEKEGCEPPFANNVLRRALRCILKLRKELKRYEELEEQGLLLRLPCKVGDRIYFIDDGEIYWDNVNVIELRKEKGEFVFCIGFMDYRKDDFGKIVFPTKAEAEKKLAEMEK